MSTNTVTLLDVSEMEETDLGMSNFDGEIDDGLAEELQSNPGKVFGSHAGWNFNSKVYFRDGKFHGEVWVYRALVETIVCDTLRGLMTETCERYGYE